MVSDKQTQLAKLQEELSTRPPSHVVVEENIRRIKAQNAEKKVKSSEVTYYGTRGRERMRERSEKKWLNVEGIWKSDLGAER